MSATVSHEQNLITTITHFVIVLSVYGASFIVFSSCSNHHDGRAELTPVLSEVEADTLLNSERIQQRFGSYGVEILHSDSTTRITSLFSREGDTNVTRTFAVVMYPIDLDPALQNEHTKILEGGSIGQVFKDSGWTVEKNSIYMGQISQSERYADVYSMMGGIDPSDLAVYMYSFEVERDGLSYEYATIAEVYHPDYLILNDLSRIYNDARDGVIAGQSHGLLLSKVRGYMASVYSMPETVK